MILSQGYSWVYLAEVKENFCGGALPFPKLQAFHQVRETNDESTIHDYKTHTETKQHALESQQTKQH